MSEDTLLEEVAAPAVPDADLLSQAEEFAREPFVHEGEDPADVLAPGTVRRRALDAALVEIAAGNEDPSVQWRRDYSLLMGLERVLSDEEPTLVDGTVLSAHQVDALSGTLIALTAAAQASNGTEVVVDVEELEPEPEPEEPVEPVVNESLIEAAEGDDATDADSDSDDDEDDEEVEEDDQHEDEDHEPSDFEEGLELDEDVAPAADDPNADRRFWFEHATGAGKTVAALGFVEATRTGGVLILTHRRNLVEQFHGELRDRGYENRISPALLGKKDATNGPVTVETYQWFVRNAGKISDAYTMVICDEAHTALGEKTSASIRKWTGPIFIGMTATGALIARHVTDLFPTQTSRFDLAQAARRGVIAPLRCVRIPPGPGVRTIAKVPLRKGEVDIEFDQELLAELLDQHPFNLAIADLYKVRFKELPGVVYAAGVQHAHHVAAAFREAGIKAKAVSGETPKRELARILAAYERGEIDVLVNAQLLAEGWNSPRATVCMHLAPTASKRIYQQRVGRVTRRHPGKEAGIVVDFVHPGTKHDDPAVTLHSLLDRDVYRGGGIVVGIVPRGRHRGRPRGRRIKVDRRVLPVTDDPTRRAEVFERELWRISVENLDPGEQQVWAQLAGARAEPTTWRRGKMMLQFDREGGLKRLMMLTAVQRSRNAQVRLTALKDLAGLRDPESFDLAVEAVGLWPTKECREGARVLLEALAHHQFGRRDQVNAWIWTLASYTREFHEDYASARWPETKRLLGLLVNSSGAAHARNARKLTQVARDQDRRLQAALLAAAVAHTPEAEEVLRQARTRMSKQANALARALVRNMPRKQGRSRSRNRKRKSTPNESEMTEQELELLEEARAAEQVDSGSDRGSSDEGSGRDQAESKSDERDSDRDGGDRDKDDSQDGQESSTQSARKRRNRNRRRRSRGRRGGSRQSEGGNSNSNGSGGEQGSDEVSASSADGQRKPRGSDEQQQLSYDD